MKPIVIIGSGMAGYSVAREFRKLDADTPLIMLTANAGGAYSKPMLSNAFAKNKNATTLLTASSQNMAKQLNIDIFTGTDVSLLNTITQEIIHGDEKIAYQKLVLAVGANPFRPPLTGNAVNDVLTVNNIDDYAKFRNAIDEKKQIIILGGGLIGSEFANDLAHAQFEVTVVDRNAWPLGNLIPQIVGKKLHQSLVALNIQWLASTSVTSVDTYNGEYQVSLDNGKRITGDVVLSAVGLKPNITLAAKSGLQINRGIVVDKTLKTSVDNIYAIGDCAEVEGFVLPFIMPIMRGARVLAQTLAGNVTEISYPTMPVLLKTPAYPISVVAPPPTEGEWKIEETESGIKALCYNPSDKLIGFALGGSATKEAGKLSAKMAPLL